MDFDKLRQWLELSQKYQSGNFWDELFSQPSFNQFMKDNVGTDNPQETQSAPPTKESNYPYIDIYLTDTDVILLAELAGYTKEQITISVSGNHLLLKGALDPIPSGQPILQERLQRSFKRIIQLPEPTNSQSIQAKLENGLLTLTYKRKYPQEEEVIIS